MPHSKTCQLRLAILGIHIESGTFSPLRSTEDDFYTLKGKAMMERYLFVSSENNVDLRDNVEWLPTVHYRAMPGGAVTAEAYDMMKLEIVNRLKELVASAPLDGVYLDIHGAMTIEGFDDAELDLLLAVRAVVGDEMIISCSQDLHGNVSADLIDGLDYISAYRTAPHIDYMETRERAMKALVRMIRSGVKPHKAWCGIPVLLSGEMTSTEVEPGATLWKQLEELIDGEEVWDVSLWAGYPWADQARAMASVVVCGEDAETVKAAAIKIAQRYWDARDDFQFLSPAMFVEECFTALGRSELLERRPLFLSDAGDNPTAGGSGDTTGVLKHLLDWANQNSGKKAIFSNIPDASAVLAAREAGVGNSVALQVGGKLDDVHSEPLVITGTVRFVGSRDNRWNCDEAVIECDAVSIILSSKRRPYHDWNDYIGLGLDPLKMDIVVVKIGYLEPELKAMAENHILLLSAGAVNPNLCNVCYTKLQRPIFPLDTEFDWSPEIVIFE